MFFDEMTDAEFLREYDRVVARKAELDRAAERRAIAYREQRGMYGLGGPGYLRCIRERMGQHA